jgi:hypothetical protein
MDLANLKAELQIKGDAAKETNKNKLKEIALQGVFQVMASKEAEVQPEWKPVINELIHNIMLPLFSDNIGQTAALGKLIAAGGQPEQPGEAEGQPEDQTDTQPEQQQRQQPQVAA